MSMLAYCCISAGKLHPWLWCNVFCRVMLWWPCKQSWVRIWALSRTPYWTIETSSLSFSKAGNTVLCLVLSKSSANKVPWREVKKKGDTRRYAVHQLWKNLTNPPSPGHIRMPIEGSKVTYSNLPLWLPSSERILSQALHSANSKPGNRGGSTGWQICHTEHVTGSSSQTQPYQSLQSWPSQWP